MGGIHHDGHAEVVCPPVPPWRGMRGVVWMVQELVWEYFTVGGGQHIADMNGTLLDHLLQLTGTRAGCKVRIVEGGEQVITTASNEVPGGL